MKSCIILGQNFHPKITPEAEGVKFDTFLGGAHFTHLVQQCCIAQAVTARPTENCLKIILSLTLNFMTPKTRVNLIQMTMYRYTLPTLYDKGLVFPVIFRPNFSKLHCFDI